MTVKELIKYLANKPEDTLVINSVGEGDIGLANPSYGNTFQFTYQNGTVLYLTTYDLLHEHTYINTSPVVKIKPTIQI